jgi:cob(I)alamin adenosyltransferase
MSNTEQQIIGGEAKSCCLTKGYVQVYTGNGKGKSTAALGLAFRAMGQGLKIYIGQFMKGHHYGELESARKAYPGIVIEQYGKDAFIHAQNPPSEEDLRLSQEGLTRAREAMLSGIYSVVILDEIITAYNFHLVSLAEIEAVIADKPEEVELILTGRYAPLELISAADLVSEIVEVKHYYQQGVSARKGIEY